MGIRIHKSIGYGFYFSEVEKKLGYTLNRSKLDFDFLENEHVFKAYIDSLNLENSSTDSICVKVSQRSDDPVTALYEMIMYDSEFGSDDFIQFIPMGNKNNWIRYDDVIDYVDYFSRHTDIDDAIITPVKGSLYPYIGLMGEIGTVDKLEKLKPSYETITRQDDGDLPYEKYWVSCYLDRDWYDNWIPVVPDHIRMLIEILKLGLPEDATKIFLSLRPYIYTYWS